MSDEKDAIVVPQVVEEAQALVPLGQPVSPEQGLQMADQEQLQKVLLEYEGVIPPDKYIKILTTGNYSALQESECAKFLFIHAVRKGLNPWKQPYIFIVNAAGKRVLYATKEASSQLRANRQLRPVLIYRGALRMHWAHQVLKNADGSERVELVPTQFDPSVYETEWHVLDEHNQVIGIDVGCGSLEGVVGRERKDEIMKIYTRGKRRAILDATGITENDESEADNDDSVPSRMKRALPPGPKRVLPKAEAVTEVPSNGEVAPPVVMAAIPSDSAPVTTPAPPTPLKRPSRPPIAAPLAKA